MRGLYLRWYDSCCGLVVQNGLADKIEKSRKQIKERKNRSKKIRGVKKNAGQHWSIICFCSIVCICLVNWSHRRSDWTRLTESQEVAEIG